jgi:hypothetical protein
MYVALSAYRLWTVRAHGGDMNHPIRLRAYDALCRMGFFCLGGTLSIGCAVASSERRAKYLTVLVQDMYRVLKERDSGDGPRSGYRHDRHLCVVHGIGPPGASADLGSQFRS